VVVREQVSHTATLAPCPPLAEVSATGELVAGKGQTFIDETYADRRFLRPGAPVKPAE
jgi:hypothetical protein